MPPHKKKPTTFDESIAEAEQALKAGFENMDDFRNSNAGEDLRQIKADDLAEVKKLDVDLFLPAEIAEFVKDTAHRLSVSPDFITIPLLIGLSSLIAGKVAMKPKSKDDFCIFPNLWGGLIGNPSSRKSDSLKQALSFFSPLETKVKEEYDDKKVQYDKESGRYRITKQALEEELKKLIKFNKPTTAIDARLNELNEPQKVLTKRFKINEATTQKITEILRDNSEPSILLERDELSGFLCGLDKKENEADRAYFLEMWNGNSTVRSDTIGRGSIIVKNASISIVGTTQHDRIKSYLEKAANSLNDGLLQRFQLLVYPDPIANIEYVDEEPNEEARQAIIEIAKFFNEGNLFNFATGSIEKDGKTYPYLAFNSEAQVIYQKWYVEILKKCQRLFKEGKTLHSQHLGKYQKLLPALCLIFYLVQKDKTQKTIDAETLSKAILFCAYLESHARRIYSILAGESAYKIKALGLVEKIKNKFRSGEKGNIFLGEFTKRDLKRKFNSYKDDELEKVLNVLVDNNYFIEKHTAAAYQQREKYSYSLHLDLIRGWENGK